MENGIVSYEEIINWNSKPAFAKICYKPEMFGQNYIKILSLVACDSTHVQTVLLRISNLHSLTQIAYLRDML